MTVDAKVMAELAALHQGLEHMSYYQFLAVPFHADYIAVRDAFHARAQRFHPDRFVFLDAEVIKELAYAVYKRMTEAYNVLSDPELRRRYDEALARGQCRLPALNRSRRLDADERKVTNAFARIYLCSARDKVERGDLTNAKIDVELALSLEDADVLRELRDRIIRAMARPEPGRAGGLS